MTGISDLFRDDPFTLWLALGALLLTVNLITGFGQLLWPIIAATAVAAVDLAGLRLTLPMEVLVFLVLTLGMALAPRKFTQPTSAYVPGIDDDGEAPRPPRRAAARPPGEPDLTGRLIGRIGRTTGEFCNGVGRVWIENAEWGAELEVGEDMLPPQTPVRVTRIQGGIRLQVRPLYA